MKYAIIENSVVVNIAIADEALESNWIADTNEAAEIGGTWDGLSFSAKVRPVDEIKADNKAKALTQLQATDWATLSDIVTGTPALTNQAAFIAYRSALRAIVLNPPSIDVTLPTQPNPAWTA